MKMKITDFGERLIQTGDLDPVYFVRHAGLPEPQMCRWLLAYWCFYHVGVASALSEREGKNYWRFILVAAANHTEPKQHGFHVAEPAPKSGPRRWPRGSERRHFRGQKCIDAVTWLQGGGEPESYARHLAALPDEREIMGAVRTWPMFGPWIAFKAADMMERVYGAPIQFSPDIGLIYEEPAAALRMLVDEAGPGWTVHTIYDALLGHFAQFGAPPSSDRHCGPQEVETILCKWKSHVRGHYPLGKDIREVRHALQGWGETADRVLKVMPEIWTGDQP